MHAVIFQNCAGAIVVIGVGGVLATIGVLTPLVAALVHAISDATFILNAVRPAAAHRR
jgi:cation transport ATPase